jgi:type IV secretion system protein TrbL
MGCSLTNPGACLSDLAGRAASSIADSAFNAIAKDFGKAAGSAVDWLWNQISSATAISLTGSAFTKDIAIVTAIAVTLATGLFLIQLMASVLRRDGAGLARAGKGLLVAFLGSVAAIAITGILLAAVDALSAGVVQAATGESVQQMGSSILTATSITAIANPAAELLLALIVLGAVVVVWAAMMIRKLLIIVAAVFAPLAFAGATSDLTTSWVRKWIETMVALVVSKLILVIIFMIGLGVLTSGLGQVTGPGGSASQSITQTIIGALILLMGGFAPWLAIKLVHFGGDHFQQIHGHAQAATVGAQTVASAPQKMQSFAGRFGSGSSASTRSRASSSAPKGTAATTPQPRAVTETAASGAGPATGGAAGGGAAAGGAAGGALAAVAAGVAAKGAVDRQIGDVGEVASSTTPARSTTPPAMGGGGETAIRGSTATPPPPALDPSPPSPTPPRPPWPPRPT